MSRRRSWHQPGVGSIATLAIAALLAGCVAGPGPTSPGATGKKKATDRPTGATANGEALVPQGGGNVVAPAGAGVIANAGGAIVSNGGAGLRPSDGAPVIARGGGNLTAGGLVAGGGLIGEGVTGATIEAPTGPAPALSGLVTLPAALIANNGGAAISNNGGNLIANNGGTLLGDHAAAYRAPRFAVAQAAAPAIEVGLVDATGALLPDTAWTRADAAGRYAFPAVPAAGPFFVRARVTSGADVWTLGAIGKLAGAAGTTLDLTPATTLVAEKARVVLAEQEQGLADLALDRLAPLVDALAAATTDATLDFRQPGAAIAARLDARLQADAGLVAKARAVDRNVGTPIVRTKVAFADGLSSPEHMAHDRAGNLFVAGLNDHTIYKIPAGTDEIEVFWKGGELRYPHGLACDAAGNVYVGRRIDVHHTEAGTPNGTDTPGKQVFKIDPQGETLTPLAHTFESPWGLAFAADGKTLLVANHEGEDVIAYDTATDVARVLASGIPYANGIAVDGRGVAYVTHLRAQWEQPDPAEDGWRGAITAIAPDGAKTLFYAGAKGVAGADALEGIAIDAADNLYVTNNWGDTIFKFTPRQKKIETFLKFNQPTGVAFDPRGDLIVADYELGTLSRVTP